MFLLDRALTGGLRFIFQKIADVADAELHDDGRLRERLLEAQMKLETGEIDDAAFEEIERDVLARLRALRVAQGADGGEAIGDGDAVSIDAAVAGDFHQDDDAPESRPRTARARRGRGAASRPQKRAPARKKRRAGSRSR